MHLSFRLVPGKEFYSWIDWFQRRTWREQVLWSLLWGESKKSDFLSETAIFFLVLLRLLVV
jgi:hypothetical protein